MRVRQFELRLIAGALSILWALEAALVLLGYRPGGPDDLLVGVAACLPIPVAIAALVWPPIARGERAYAAIVWIGLGAILLLVPSIGGVRNQLEGRGPQTLLPSPEAAYPWLLALAATSLFSGLGIARRLLGSASLRRARLVRGVLLATMFTAGASGAFSAVAIANDTALRDRPAIASRFGPTTGDPPLCDDPLSAGPQAHIELTIVADIDGHAIGNLDLTGTRSGSDVRWTADVVSARTVGSVGAAQIGRAAWERLPRGDWTSVDTGILAGALLDRQVVSTALALPQRSAPEERGLEFVEGARARHCRIAITGTTFALAFPQVSWIVGQPDLHRWRGRLDYWVFSDGEVGQVDAAVNGEAVSLGDPGLQANLRATMIATDRDRPVSITPPTD
jgi:hypothetical protein